VKAEHHSGTETAGHFGHAEGESREVMEVHDIGTPLLELFVEMLIKLWMEPGLWPVSWGGGSKRKEVDAKFLRLGSVDARLGSEDTDPMSQLQQGHGQRLGDHSRAASLPSRPSMQDQGDSQGAHARTRR
jgi:hypothetical protein